MKTIAPDEATEAEESDFAPLTAQQAQEWRKHQWGGRKHQAPLSVGRLLAAQAMVGMLVGLLALGLTGRAAAGWSAACGARAAVLPRALLAAAAQWVPGLSWVALLVGMASAMKMYWVALWVWPGVRKTVSV